MGGPGKHIQQSGALDQPSGAAEKFQITPQCISGTGYVNYYSKYDSTIDAKYNSTTSGVADFEWREASDGAIYLFKTAERFNENNVNSDSIPVIAHAIHFSDDCFVYSHVYNGFSNTIKYIKEGTKLADAIKNVEK